MRNTNATEVPPYEQDWEVGTDGKAVWRKGAPADMVYVPAEGHGQSPAQIAARAKLISASPKMARGLRAVLHSPSDVAQTEKGRRIRVWMTEEDIQALADAMVLAEVPL